MTPDQSKLVLFVVALIAPFVWNFIKTNLGVVDAEAYWLVFFLSAILAILCGIGFGLITLPQGGDPISVIQQVIVILSTFWGIAQFIYQAFLSDKPMLWRRSKA